MQYEIEVDGRARQVTVTRSGSSFAVSVDGRTWKVDAARIDAHTLSLLVDGVSHAHRAASHEVAVAADVQGGLSVRVDGVPVNVSVSAHRRSRRGGEGHAVAGPQRLLAPMPGKVVRVLVETGAVVAARQPLVVVEAMKMENELRAQNGGTVVEVRAREGQSVDAGALLIVIQ